MEKFDRIQIVSQFWQSHEQVLIKEYFFSEDCQDRLPLFLSSLSECNCETERERPSGGLAKLSRFRCKVLTETDYFIVAKLEHHVVRNVYLPTNYSNEQSDSRFASTCKHLGSFLKKFVPKPVIISGDFNVDIINTVSPRP